MYRKFSKDRNEPTKLCEVKYQSYVEGGLLDEVTKMAKVVLSNPGALNSLSNMVRQGGLSNSANPTSQSNYIQYPGISLVKTNYQQIKAELLRQGQLFWDSEFPANQIQMTASDLPIVWKRPFEICQNPQMFTAGISRFDINQGKLGDCWLLAAISSLVIHGNLLSRVIPLDQTFNRGDYCGMFRFYIWYYGQWMEIIIDDLLPTCNGELIYMSSKEPTEFWSALLEKAYAKIFGSYGNLKGGSTSEAMVDFTGGITETYKLRKNQSLTNNLNQINDLYFVILNAYINQALMSCSKDGGLETRDNSGLVSRHAYSVTAVCIVNTLLYGQAYLIRLRNPWGNEVEWKGPWSDNSREWQYVSPQELHRLQIVKRADGEFWMSFYDFVSNFDKIEICHIEPQSLEDLGQIKNKEIKTKKSWNLTVVYGSWKRGINAGGCMNYASHYTNPHFEMTITEPDDETTNGLGTVIVGLMQRNLRMFNRELVAIGYSIYEKPKSVLKLFGNENIKSLHEVASSGTFINLREVTGRHKLYPGSYIIIPSTFNPNEESQFLIRIFSVKKTQAQAFV